MRRSLKPKPTCPVDFFDFWQRTLRELAAVETNLERTLVRHTRGEQYLLERLVFHSLDGAQIHAYLLRATSEQPRPLAVHAHGYESRYEVNWDWAEAGLNVCGVDIRGFGRSKDALKKRSRHGYVLTGIDSPESSVLRGAVCDYLRAAEVAGKLLSPSVTRRIFYGQSFAGGLALMAEAIARVCDILVVAVPTFGWAEGRHFFVKLGSGAEINRYLSNNIENTEDVMTVLRYFDPINFASLISCPTLVGVGAEDDVVPAKTVYAIANHLGSPCEVMEFPISHSQHPDECHWEAFDRRLLELALEGPSPNFGKKESKQAGD